ncbi:MAG: insulinase family protein [Patescibacteria group bacterium]|nr:insulinase family protein [Patescibacteria group bacterium]
MKFNKTVLPNGLRVITVPMRETLSATVMVLAETGSNYEEGRENGISHLLEHMVFKGTLRRPGPTDISRELDFLGAESNAFTTFESTGFHAKVDHRNLAAALDIIADMYLDPQLDAAELEKEKGVIIEEMRMYRDMPQSEVFDAFIKLVYGDQPAGRKVIGTEETVRAITAKELDSYRRGRYVAESTVVVVSGGIDEKAVLTDIERIFARIPTTPKVTKKPVDDNQNEPRVVIADKTTDQTHLILGVRSVPIGDPRRYPLLILANLLGGGFSSRLFTTLRDEMGAAYYVYADNSLYTDHGLFTVAAGVDNKRVEEIIAVIMKKLTEILNQPISEAELTKVKNHLSGKIVLSLETSDELAHYVGADELFEGHIDDPADVLARIQAVTVEEVSAAARDIFVDHNLNLALIGPYKAEDAERFKKHLTFR